MYLIQPHYHAIARTTQDYERMADAGVVAVAEPAFWAGFDRDHPESFLDYFKQITEFEPTRAAQYGIRHFSWLAVNPKEAENRELTRAVCAQMPRYLKSPNCLGVGETGLHKSTPNEIASLEEHIQLALDYEGLVLIHTPHLADKLHGTRKVLEVLENFSGLNRQRVWIDHVEEHTIELVLNAGYWAGMTLYPQTKMSPRRAVDILLKYGWERMLVNSSADWGPSDPATLMECIAYARKRGFSEQELVDIFHNAPVRFCSQNPKWDIKPLHLSTEVSPNLAFATPSCRKQVSPSRQPEELPLMIGLPGPELDSPTRQLLQEIRPQAVILFRRNCEEAAQVRSLTDALRALLGDQLLIAIDEEGGRVSRLDNFCTATPAAAALSSSSNLLHPVQAATITARRLRMLGIDWNLAPVLDLGVASADGMDNALSGRCWGIDSKQILNTAGPWLETFRKEKILSCVKHFPGSGRAQVDPHLDLPRVDASMAELEADLAPFMALADRLDSVMVGHLHFVAHSGEPPKPASLEPKILLNLLRYRVGYQGVVLSDDLEMEAVMQEYSPAQATLASLEAGVDLPLICHTPERMAEAAHALTQEFARSNPRLWDARKSVAKLQKRARPQDQFEPSRWQHLEEEAKRLQAEVSYYRSQNYSSPVQNY